MKTSTRIALAAVLAASSGAASAIPCKQMVGTWHITYDLLGDWTDTVVITSVRGGKVDAEDEFGNPLSAACRNGMVYAVADDSDYIVNSWYFSNNFGRIAAVFESDSVLDEALTSTFHAATRIERVSGQSASTAASPEDLAAAREARNQERKNRFLQQQALPQ